ncbi:MAG: phage head-tail joining protein [Alphaproteobacteria bacterium]
MAWTTDDLEALRAALASGAQRVTLPGGKTIEYRSVADLRSAIAMVQGELDRAAGTPRVRQSRFVSGGIG